ncbi:small nuclear ribonucleoprotein Sm-D (nucleomorph) [Lotharella oceanica]|uniref:Small nuclear ribonucleoprotein Sm-D n=1 Tax=Lotharella oceanica TaxID=641309 RepID=A0A060DFP8_9EUKA|nr:small nuclear ribonucleoprotein Sm-D [Lotharella oceanica]
MNKSTRYLSNLYNETVELNLKNKTKIIGILTNVDHNGNIFMKVSKIYHLNKKIFFVTDIIIRGSALKYIVFPENIKFQEIFNELNKK